MASNNSINLKETIEQFKKSFYQVQSTRCREKVDICGTMCYSSIEKS